MAENLDSIIASHDREWVVQNSEKLAKRIPAFQKKFSAFASDTAREMDKVVSIGVDKAKDVRRGIKKGAKDVKTGAKKVLKKIGFGYEVAML